MLYIFGKFDNDCEIVGMCLLVDYILYNSFQVKIALNWLMFQICQCFKYATFLNWSGGNVMKIL